MFKKITLVGLFVLASAVSLPLASSQATTTASLTPSSPAPQQPHGFCKTPWLPWLCK